jgi:hypothetical protein
MLTSSVRRAALILSGSAVVVAGSVLPAQATVIPGWRSAATVTVKDRRVLLAAITAPAANDAWASGVSVTSKGADTREVMEHWNGRSWTQVSLPSSVASVWPNLDGAFQVMGASSGSNVWAFGQTPGGKRGDAYLRLSGRRWTTGTLPGSKSRDTVVNAVEVLSSSDVWAFGGQANLGSSESAFTPYAAHFNGKRWSTFAVPGTNAIAAVSAVTSGNMWAVTGTTTISSLFSTPGPSTSTVLHWNGSSWREAAVQPSALPADADLTAITAGPGNRLTIGGEVVNSDTVSTSAFVDQFNGTAWSSAPSTLANFGKGGEVASLVPNGHGGLWALSSSIDTSASQLWQYSGGRWSSPVSPKFGNRLCELMQLVSVSGGKSVWAAATAGTDSSPHGVIAVEGPTPR